MKIKVTRRRIIFLILFISIAALIVMIYPNLPFPIYSIDYYGITLEFRINLRDARSIPVYPNEEAVQSKIMNELVENITIVFKPGSGQENAFYAVETHEIVYKLAVGYSERFGYMPSFNVVNVTSYENLTGSPQNPVIVLISPIQSNETLVRLEGHIVFIQSKNSTSLTEQLRNFDLATVKFIMTTLGISLNN